MKISVKCEIGEEGEARALREMFCLAARSTYPPGHNVLTETNFNSLLNALVQIGFDAGMQYEAENSRGK